MVLARDLRMHGFLFSSDSIRRSPRTRSTKPESVQKLRGPPVSLIGPKATCSLDRAGFRLLPHEGHLLGTRSVTSHRFRLATATANGVLSISMETAAATSRYSPALRPRSGARDYFDALMGGD
jgi:hypothetical protein